MSQKDAVNFTRCRPALPQLYRCGTRYGICWTDRRNFALHTRAVLQTELPCILSLLEQFEEVPDEMLIDGYVMLGDRPGLGQHLFESFSGKIPVIGVAKSKYRDSSAGEVFRGGSKRPLYVTSAGIGPQKASEKISLMRGAHNIPTLLKRADLLARGKTRCLNGPLA